VIHVRNTHPTRMLYLPHCPFWERVLRPAATTMLSPRRPVAPCRAARAQPSGHRRGDRGQPREQRAGKAAAGHGAGDCGGRGTGTRQARPGCATAEAKQRHGWWTPERRATFERLWRTGASLDAIATACQLNRSSVPATGYRLGLPPRRQPAADIARSQRRNSGSSTGCWPICHAGSTTGRHSGSNICGRVSPPG
jgi:hypothetical protein